MTYLQESDLVGERHFIKRPKCKQQQRPITEDLTRSGPEAQRTSRCFMLPPSTCLCFLFPASGVGSLSVAARCFPLIAPAASECCQSFLPFSSSFSHHPYRPDNNTYHLSTPFLLLFLLICLLFVIYHPLFLCIPLSPLSFLSFQL